MNKTILLLILSFLLIGSDCPPPVNVGGVHTDNESNIYFEFILPDFSFDLINSSLVLRYYPYSNIDNSTDNSTLKYIGHSEDLVRCGQDFQKIESYRIYDNATAPVICDNSTTL